MILSQKHSKFRLQLTAGFQNWKIFDYSGSDYFLLILLFLLNCMVHFLCLFSKGCFIGIKHQKIHEFATYFFLATFTSGLVNFGAIKFVKYYNRRSITIGGVLSCHIVYQIIDQIFGMTHQYNTFDEDLGLRNTYRPCYLTCSRQ